MKRYGLGSHRQGHAPDSCTRCYKPDTAHILLMHGDEQWIHDVLIALVGIPQPEARRFAQHVVAHSGGTAPGDRVHAQLRLCLECAALTDAPVVPAAVLASTGETALVLVEPEVWPEP